MSGSVPGPDTSDMAPVHQVFRTALSTAPELVASVAGNPERRELIANYYDNIVAFLHAHHGGEDALVYPLLHERAPESRAVLELGERQHEEVSPLMDAVTVSIGSWRDQGDTGAAAVLGAMDALNAVLIPHLDHEEAEVVPIAAAHLTAEEWGGLPGHALRTFEGDKVWLILGLIRENFTKQQRDAMLANMPPPVREMWEQMGEAAFEDLIAAVRR